MKKLTLYSDFRHECSYLTWSGGDTAQCVLLLETDGNNGILVDADVTDYSTETTAFAE